MPITAAWYGMTDNMNTVGAVISPAVLQLLSSLPVP